MSQDLTLNYEVNDDLADRMALLVLGPMPASKSRPPLARLEFVVITGGAVVIMIVAGIVWNINWQFIFPLPILGTAIVLPLGIWALLQVLRTLAYRRIRSALLGPFRGLEHRHVSWAFSERGFTFESAKRSIRAEWTDLSEVLVTRGFQTIRLRSGEDVSIPAPALTPEVAGLIRRKATAYGATVRTV